MTKLEFEWTQRDWNSLECGDFILIEGKYIYMMSCIDGTVYSLVSLTGGGRWSSPRSLESWINYFERESLRFRLLPDGFKFQVTVEREEVGDE